MGKAVFEDIDDFIKNDEFDAELSTDNAIEDVEFPEEEEEGIEIESDMDRIKKIFRNELRTPEYGRMFYELKMRDGSKIEGVPMAELPSGDAFLFKINGQIKKIKLENINKISAVEEEINESLSENPFEELKIAMQDLAIEYEAELIIENDEVGFEIGDTFINVEYDSANDEPYFVTCLNTEIETSNEQYFRSLQETMDYVEHIADNYYDLIDEYIEEE